MKKINTLILLLLISINGKVIDSLVNFTTEWSENDLILFKYIGKLICEKRLKKTKELVPFPTWEMVKP